MSDKEKTNGSLAMAPRVITIPAANQKTARKLRVAAYTRVSSNSEDQKHSFAAQNAYYSKLITDNPDWELADVYADQGITGTSIDKRDDFLRMMEDCRKGRIDRILVKSSSRFARNTKESLEAVRELAVLGVSVYFEEQNIDTAQVSGEVLIAMFAALAQRESEAISGRTRWGIQRCMEQGRFTPTAIPLGYRKDKAGNIFIDEEQAKYIRIIFKEFLDGKNSRDIAAALDMEQKKLGQVQGAYRWTYGAVIRILRNEKYTGNSIWQKTYRTDDLSHRRDTPLTLADERIARAIRENNARLVIIDPMQAFLGADVDMNRANEVRPIFRSLGDIAQATGCAIVLIGHLNKAAGTQSTYRGLGSIDITAAVRSLLFIGKLKDSPTTRVLIHEKSSLAPPGQSLAFSLGDEKGFEWIGAYDITADELLTGTDTAKTESKTAQAEMLILELLADGKKMPSAELEKAVNDRGISSRTMRTAKSRIGDRLVTEKDGTAWVCYLRS